MFKEFQIARFLSLVVILFAVSACLDLEPDTATNVVGTEHTVIATVVLEDGEPGEGALITFNVISGPNAGEMSDPNSGECSPNDCTTDANGQVSWTYSSELIGTDTIVATASGSNGETEIEVESDPVEKIWVSPQSIPTLSEWGLIAMAAILGIVGFMVIRRRKAAV